MLHITLTILKIIGIILLALLLLVIAVLIAVLLVPLRYRLQAVYTNEHVRGELCFTWLLHLISVRLALEEETSPVKNDVTDAETPPGFAGQPFSRFAHVQTNSEVRILGIRLESFLAFFEKFRSGKNRQKEKKEKESRIQSSKREAANVTEGSVKEAEKVTAKAGKEAAEVPKAKAGKESVEEPKEKAAETVKETARGSSGREDLQGSKKIEESDPEGGSSRKFENLLHKLSNICDKIRKMPLLLKQFCSQIKELLSKPGRIKERVERFVRKLEKYQAYQVLSEAWIELKRLLHHYRVRDGSGYIRFGTGDPALTGEVAGLLYLVFPASCGGISIEPQFTQTMLDTEIQIRGHIRVVHLLRTAWWAFRNKKLRRFVHSDSSRKCRSRV